MGVAADRLVRNMIIFGEHSSSVGRLGRRGIEAWCRVSVDLGGSISAPCYAYCVRGRRHHISR